MGRLMNEYEALFEEPDDDSFVGDLLGLLGFSYGSLPIWHKEVKAYYKILCLNGVDLMCSDNKEDIHAVITQVSYHQDLKRITITSNAGVKDGNGVFTSEDYDIPDKFFVDADTMLEGDYDKLEADFISWLETTAGTKLKEMPI